MERNLKHMLHCVSFRTCINTGSHLEDGLMSSMTTMTLASPPNWIIQTLLWWLRTLILSVCMLLLHCITYMWMHTRICMVTYLPETFKCTVQVPMQISNPTSYINVIFWCSLQGEIDDAQNCDVCHWRWVLPSGWFPHVLSWTSWAQVHDVSLYKKCFRSRGPCDNTGFFIVSLATFFTFQDDWKYKSWDDWSILENCQHYGFILPDHARGRHDDSQSVMNKLVDSHARRRLLPGVIISLHYSYARMMASANSHNFLGLGTGWVVFTLIILKARCWLWSSSHKTPPMPFIFLQFESSAEGEITMQVSQQSPPLLQAEGFWADTFHSVR